MSRLENRRILIIDDNSCIHEDFRKILGDVRPQRASLDAKEAFLFGQTPQAEPVEGFEIDSGRVMIRIQKVLDDVSVLEIGPISEGKEIETLGIDVLREKIDGVVAVPDQK